MRPLHDAETMRATDAWAIEQRHVPSLELMEAAGGALAETVAELARPGPVRVVCGKGNNGGDGLVAARHLAALGFEAEVLLLWPGAELRGDAAANLERCRCPVRELDAEGAPAALAGSGAVVDAIFGTGFAGAPRGPAAGAIDAINTCEAPVIAADIASGVNASTGEVEAAAVRATATVSFHAAKLGQLVAPGKRHAGELRVVAIGIPSGAQVLPPAGVIEADVLEALPRRGPDSTKFSSGQVLIAGGSRGLTGAVCMTAEAACRAGAGYATVAVPADLETVFEVKLTEVMSIGCASADGHLRAAAASEIAAAADRAAAVVVGPGLGRRDDAAALVGDLLARIAAPLLLDADGLNALAGDLAPVADRSAPTVLTPHAGELARLLGTEPAHVSTHRLACAREAAERCGAVVVLKGDDTIVAAPQPPVAVNALSSPALATAGTGDVLSGVIAALMARGMEPFQAAAAGVYAHARAGRIAATRIGAPEAVIASDVIAALPAGLRREPGA